MAVDRTEGWGLESPCAAPIHASARCSAASLDSGNLPYLTLAGTRYLPKGLQLKVGELACCHPGRAHVSRWGKRGNRVGWRLRIVGSATQHRCGMCHSRERENHFRDRVQEDLKRLKKDSGGWTRGDLSPHSPKRESVVRPIADHLRMALASGNILVTKYLSTLPEHPLDAYAATALRCLGAAA